MNRMWRNLLARCLAIWLVAAPVDLMAQSGGGADTTEPVILGYRTSIHSTLLGEDRPVMVYTPQGYEQSSESYPVLYLLDGDGHFHHASGVTQFLSANNRMPAMIVVGIPNLSQEGRTRNLTPPLTVPNIADRFPTAGGGREFLRFLTEELKPWVESNYRTHPYNILVGHSFGGLFNALVLMEDPEAFEAHISISPSLWWDDGEFVAKAASLFEEHQDLTGAWYMTMGNEGGAMLAGAWDLAGTLETSAPDSFRWKWSHMPEEDHGSVHHRSLYYGLEWVFEGWNLPNIAELAISEGGEGWGEIDEHYRKLSERYGFRVRVPEDFVNQIGYYLLGQKRVEDAVKAFEVNADHYPSSANVHDSLGDGYDAACRWEEAEESYAKAYEIALEQESPNADAYKANLDRITAKIEAGEECTVPGKEPGTG